jgi:hypothetical protein
MTSKMKKWKEARNSMALNKEQVEDFVQAEVEETVEVLGAEGINAFIDYIKHDPGLCIPIDIIASIFFL